MSRIERVQRVSALLHSFTSSERCDSSFSNGLRLFADSLTPSHSLTSRTPSLRAIMRQHLDQPFLEVLSNYSGQWDQSLLEGKLLSEMPYESPSDSVCRHPDEMTADWYIRNLQAWDERIRRAIHSVHDTISFDPEPTIIDDWDFDDTNADPLLQENSKEFSVRTEFTHTLDCVRLTLKHLIYFRPKSGTVPLQRRRQLELAGLHPPLGPILDSRTRPQSGTYCQLCWRTTMRSKAMTAQKHPNGPASQARKQSNRYCHVHNPSDPKSKYRRDLPYKKLFNDELLAFDYGLGQSQFILPPILPSGPDEQEVRKAVYEMIRMGTHSISPKEGAPPRLRQRILALYRSGMTQSEIARYLGISRQAVSVEMKKIQAYLAQRSRDINDPTSMN